jgi:multidrug efflux pump subunit AcrB
MLPFDNKSEFQLILNMPEGTALEQTLAVATELTDAISAEPEIRDFQIYAGTAAPFNFNGLVRHYFLRSLPSGADIQVNLLDKHNRSAQSHEIAKRVRPRLQEIAKKYNARLAVSEVPPGPPVLQTLVAEIYGPTPETRLELARKVKESFHQTEGAVDVDWYVEDDQRKVRFVIDKEKGALHGISAEAISQTLRIAVGGTSVDLLHCYFNDRIHGRSRYCGEKLNHTC